MHTVLLVAPLALICLLGFISVKVKLFDQTQTSGISKLCFTLLIPLFLFKSTYSADLNQNVSLGWFLSFYLPVILVYGLVYIGYQWQLSRQTTSQVQHSSSINTRSAVSALTASYSNTVLISIPILIKLLNEEVAGLAFVLIAFHSAVLFTLTEMLATNRTRPTPTNASSNSSTAVSAIKKIKMHSYQFLRGLNNPIVISISLGLIANILNFTFPKAMLQALTMMSQAAVPLALFSLGTSMYFLPLKGSWVQAVLLSAIKLLALPFIVYLMAQYVFDLNNIQTLIVVLLTASPTGINAYLIAAKHQQQQAVSATTVIVSTAICLVSIVFWVELISNQ
ncbi:AEC family transporter [Flocculibacter collagenilyticus]|uniref:AEC family transporter n=1 Tax=Flocculibacter collagenilyticus TaxID=2744479 RepID=UPI0018F75181|nr:AEC family transporter [Flocculibacter collagenilyticus]